MQRRAFVIAAGAGAVSAADAALPGRATPLTARTLLVGPMRWIRTIGEAARVAQDGDHIEVDAGDYVGDVAVWRHNDITITAVGGRVRLPAGGASAEGKGTWIVDGNGFTVSGFDFLDSAVADGNGAGIRFGSGSLTVRDCTFIRNQSGILTSNDRTSVLDVQNCEFAYNTNPDGRSHHLYAGTIGRLSVSGSYFHHAAAGHLLKSRAAISEIFYNRLTDEAGGSASYEIDLPSGGVAYVLGNIVSQSAQADNRTVISYGAEGYTWPNDRLFLINNTLIDRPGSPGRCLAVLGGASVRMVNNLMVGQDAFFPPGINGTDGNVGVSLQAFERQSDSDFRLRPGSALIGNFSAPGRIDGKSLAPQREYVHPRGSVALTAPARNPGAMQSLGGGQR